MSALARIAEARIEEAIARGELDDLPGAGRLAALQRRRMALELKRDLAAERRLRR